MSFLFQAKARPLLDCLGIASQVLEVQKAACLPPSERSSGHYTEEKKNCGLATELFQLFI